MTFPCTKCGQEVHISKLDAEWFKKHGWVCNECYTIIHPKNYSVNIKGAKTFFSPMGDGLGDRILNSVLREQYLQDNPDEDITFCETLNQMYDMFYGRIKYRKVFWSSLTQIGNIPKGSKTYNFLHSVIGDKVDNLGIDFTRPALWYSLINEANAYAKDGIYPKWKEFKKPNVELPEKYVILHERNIGKADAKNMEPQIAFALESFLAENKINVVLLGNDNVITGMDNGFLDLRKKLTLPEMAWVIRQSSLFVGKDSGVAHLAGACSDVPLIVYGFRSLPWVPKVKPERITYWHEYKTDIYEIKEKIKEKLSVA